MAEEQTAASVTEQKEGKGREPGTFQLVSDYKPSGDQPEAIKELVEGVKEGKQCQVLMGATGTGKTFTISNVIEQVVQAGYDIDAEAEKLCGFYISVK